ncbi:MAG TPA: hypothetical protein VLN45_00270 [Ignavibacteriaceae bacterium]|nr:hypothetical protein [Ignavibacteriaceae bacterium]
MKINTSKILSLAFLPILFFLPSCDIFSTRDAERPTEPRSDLPPANSLEILIDNFEKSNEQKLVQDYINCLSDSVFTGRGFTFIPSSEAASQYPALSDWDIQSEENFFRNVISASIEGVQISLNILNENFSQQGDSLIYTASYSLTVPFVDTDIPQNYQGEIEFHIFVDNTSIFRIYFWQDFKSSDLPSWSELKGRLAN